MYVERWQDLINLLDNIKPLVKPIHKIGCTLMRVWGVANQNRHHGLVQVNINAAIKAFNDVIPYLPSEWVARCEHAIYFLNHLNDSPNPNWIETEKGCLFWDFYWWDGGCHKGEQPPPPPPPPPPPKKVCSDYTSERECLMDGCYWYDNACHDHAKPPDPPDPPPDPPLPPKPPPPPPPGSCDTEEKCTSYGYFWKDGKCYLNLAGDIENTFNISLLLLSHESENSIYNMVKTAESKYNRWFSLLTADKLLDWVWDAAMQQTQNEQLLKNVIDPLIDWANRLAAVIGDVTKLDGDKPIIDLLLEKSGEADKMTRTILGNLLADIGFSYNTLDGSVTRHLKGLVAKMQKVVDACVDSEMNVTVLTIGTMDDRLESVYKITAEIFAKVKSESEYSYTEIKKVEAITGMTLSEAIQTILVGIGSITKNVDLEIGNIVGDGAKPIQYWIPATQGWVTDKINEFARGLGTTLKEFTEELSEIINDILNVLVGMPQWWIDELKKKLEI